MKTFGVALGFQTWFGLSVCNAMFNYYLPARSGLAARAYYLKRRHQFGYSQYVSVTTGSTIAALPISAGTGLVTVPSIALTGGVLHWKLAILFGALLVTTMLGIVGFALLRKWGLAWTSGRVNMLLRTLDDGLRLLRTNKRFLVAHSVVHVAGILTWAARLYIAFHAIDVPVSYLHMLAPASLAMFAFFLPLTPASLGVSEGIIVGFAHFFGIPPDSALLAALIDRAVALVMTVSLGLLFSRILLTDILSTSKKK